LRKSQKYNNSIAGGEWLVEMSVLGTD